MKTQRLALLFLFILPSILVQSKTIIGTIKDAQNNLIVGASVTLLKSSVGTASNAKGEFSINSTEDSDSIKISFLGYETQRLAINTFPGDIILRPSIANLQELTIVSYTQPVKQMSDVIYSGTAITDKGISLMGAAANNSVYNVIDLMPAISVENSDAYGLSERVVKIRGVKNYFSGMTLNGFPNYGIMPIGARDDIYDMENIQQISIYKGASPADLGSATGSKGGVIELQYKQPQDRGIHVNQSYGMYNYLRTYLRVDAGKTKKTETNFFISSSLTQADKWKGSGQLGPRKNMALGIVQPLFQKLLLEINLNYNSINRDDFRSLTYAQASNLPDNYKLDFYDQLLGTPENDMYYQGYNQGEFINKDLMSTLTYKVSHNQKMSLKYYTSTEDADYLEGVKKGTNYFVFNRIRDVNRMGVIPEYSGNLANFKYTAGYWFESSDNNASVYSSKIIADGLQDIGYSYFTVKDKNGKIHSPYVKAAYTYNNLNVQAGLKYFYYQDPESERYQSISATELSSTPNSDLHTSQINHKALLPTIGIGYQFNPKLEGYVNYGKNYMRPYAYSPIISLYVKNQSTFSAQNMTLQDIFDSWTMETSDNFDLGIRYNTNRLNFYSSIFYGLHHDVLAVAYDPVVNLDYYQNVGELTAYGIDVECYIAPVKNLMVFVNPAYTVISYNDEIIRASNALGIKGNQTPATPKFSYKTGVSYTYKKISATAKLKYTGERYGDATNTEKVDAYYLADVMINYTKRNVWEIKELTASIEFKNLLNTEYIGIIDVSDDSNAGSAMYYSGAPFTALGNISFKF